MSALQAFSPGTEPSSGTVEIPPRRHARARGETAAAAAAPSGRRPRVTLALAVLVATGALDLGAAWAAASEPAPLRRVEVPGRLLDSAVVSRDGVRTLALLVREDPSEEGGEGSKGGPHRSGRGPADRPEPSRDLYVLDPAAGRLELVASGLPEPAGRLIPLDAVAGGVDQDVGPGGGPALVAERFGHLDLLSPAAPAGAGPAAGEAGAALASFDLPRRAERTARGLRLTSPAAHPLPAAGSGSAGAGGTGGPCFATEPEAHGRRLRVEFLCSGAAEPEELWMLLPAAETVTAARFLDLDGTRVLAVLTRDKLGVFVKQDLRVFPLETGRARLGSDPLLATSTGCPLWRDHELTAADADGDGSEDVVLLCRRGLIDAELRVEVYPSRREAEGVLGFERRGRAMNLEGDYDSWRYGTDLTGDGLPDLVAQRDGWTLELHAGRGRGGAVEPRPAWTLPVPRDPSEEDGDGEDPDGERVEVSVGTDGGRVRVLAGGATLIEVLDLDGDGRHEILLYQRLREERGEDRIDRGGRLAILTAP